MFIQRGFLSCKSCEKAGIVPELQWNIPNNERCLGCNEKMTSSTGTNLFDPVAKLVRAFTSTHGFRFDDMGTKKQSPDIAGVSDVPQISLSSRVIPGLTATITWHEMPVEGGEQSGKTWKEFTGKHTDLLVPVDLTSVVASLNDEYPVTWNNLAGVRKQVRMTRYVQAGAETKLWVELEFCWEVPEFVAAAARAAAEHRKRIQAAGISGNPLAPGSVRIKDLMPEATVLAYLYFGRGGEAGDLHSPETAMSSAGRKQVDEAVMSAMGHLWFGDCVTQKWWEGLWLNEAYARFVANAAANEFGGVLSAEVAETYRRGVARLAKLPPDRLAKMLDLIEATKFD
jgi:hypothetical protein